MNKPPIIRWVVVLLFALGFVSRAVPLLNIDERLFKHWVTEDGYLMLTIARNMGVGKGMSIADGDIATNGTQPLVTFLFASAYYFLGGDKTYGIYATHLWEILIAMATARVIWLFSRDVLRDSSFADSVPPLAAAFWWASPVFIPHTMNHLETGTYFFMIAVSLWVWYLQLSEPEPSCRTRAAIWVGLLLGITTLVRIDAVFVIASVTVWNVLPSLVSRRELLGRRLLESFLMGSVAVLVASPWLINNKLHFGSFTPISGSSQSLAFDLESSAPGYVSGFIKTAPIHCEFASVIMRLPTPVQENRYVQWTCFAIIMVLLAGHGLLAARSNARQRVLLAICATMFGAFTAYYSVHFGAPYFLPRYLAPPCLFFAVTSMLIVVYLVRKVDLEQSRVAVAGCVVALAIVVAFHCRFYLHGATHMHWHVVEWCRENVPEDQWVAAIQTGTLGYFHDRTINLDGKVNPLAFQARLNQGIPRYVVEGPAEYLIDWHGILDWRTQPEIREHFEVIVDEPDVGYNGLGVWRRKAPAIESTTHRSRRSSTVAVRG